MAPQSTSQWAVKGTGGFDDLEFQNNVSLRELESHEVLVQFKYASINYRDILIPKVLPFPNQKIAIDMEHRDNILFQ
jgi:NADPH:quinone reductase-like Zn-dependent oxidoreductase